MRTHFAAPVARTPVVGVPTGAPTSNTRPARQAPAAGVPRALGLVVGLCACLLNGSALGAGLAKGSFDGAEAQLAGFTDLSGQIAAEGRDPRPAAAHRRPAGAAQAELTALEEAAAGVEAELEGEGPLGPLGTERVKPASLEAELEALEDLAAELEAELGEGPLGPLDALRMNPAGLQAELAEMIELAEQIEAELEGDGPLGPMEALRARAADLLAELAELQDLADALPPALQIEDFTHPTELGVEP